jgi:hypothetical protein
LIVTRWSGPALYGVAPFCVDHALPSVSSMRNCAGRPGSSLEAETTVAPFERDARFGATRSVIRRVPPAPNATPLNVWTP